MPDTRITPGVLALLAKPLNAVFATIRDGSPELAPVWFIWKDARIAVSTSTATRRWANLERDPRCSMVIDDREADSYVAISGRAQLVRGDVRALTREIVARYIAADRVDDYMRDIVYTGAERTIILLEPSRLVAFATD